VRCARSLTSGGLTCILCTMLWRFSRLGLAGASIAALTVAAPVWAQPPAPAPESEAVKLFRDGVKLAQEGKCPEALPLLIRSFELEPSPNSDLVVARCLRDTGKPVEALARYESAAAEAQKRVAEGQTKYERTADEAKREGAVVRSGLGTVTVEVRGAEGGATVEIEGVKVALDANGQAKTLRPPGRTRVVVKVAPDKTFDRAVEVGAGTDALVAVDVATGQIAEPKPKPKPKPKPSGPTRRDWAYPASWVAGGLATAGFAAFAGLGLSSQSLYDELETDCGSRCGARSDDVERGRSLQLGANVALGVAAGLSAVSVAFAVVALTDPGPEVAAPDEEAALRVGPSGVTLELTWGAR
jgi:hypothetical protein